MVILRCKQIVAVKKLMRLTLQNFVILTEVCPIIVLLYIQNSHTKMQANCGSKKTHAINIATFCYFVIFARFELVTSSESNNFFLDTSVQ